MNTSKNIKNTIVSILLLTAMMVPSCIQFFHQLEEDHSFSICLEQNDHIHENSVHCDICDFQFSTFIFEFASHPKAIVTPIISKTTIGTTMPLCYNLALINTQLRAPPTVFS